MSWLWRQWLDLAAYWLLPFLAFLLPAGAARVVVRFASRRPSFFQPHAAQALSNVSAVEPVPDPQAWQRAFRCVRFIDAVDTWHGHFSSDRRITRGLVTGPARWPQADSLVLLGTHLGPGTLFLRQVAAAGWRPRFVFRELQGGLRRQAPVYHAYLRWRMAYLRKVCAGREIRVPGGREAVSEALREPGTALVLLLDAPAERPRGAVLTLRGRSLPVDPGGLALAADAGATGARFAMVWDEASGRRVIEVSEPFPIEDRETELRRMEDYLNGWLETHPAQWQLWLTARPVLGPDA